MFFVVLGCGSREFAVMLLFRYFVTIGVFVWFCVFFSVVFFVALG